jgi:NADH-quinone oxidoreductase subunit A
MRSLGWGGFVAALIFIVVLTVGMIYEWKKGALEWE